MAIDIGSVYVILIVPIISVLSITLKAPVVVEFASVGC